MRKAQMQEAYKMWHVDWTNMSDVAKLKYTQMAKKNKRQYEKDVQEWKERNEFEDIGYVYMEYERSIKNLKDKLSDFKRERTDKK